MAVITLQFGQCGNQIGFQLLSHVSDDIFSRDHGIGQLRNKEYMSDNIEKFFRTSPGAKDKLIARSILVDTEKKVLQNVLCQSAHLPWSYDGRNIVNGYGGSANNWAYGHSCRGPELSEIFMDSLRKETEKCDRISLLFGLLSSAGGTGSGVGSYLLENVRDSYPKKMIANAIVLPYEKGEVAVQNYNTLFTLTSLLTLSDAIVLFRNDCLHNVCKSHLNIQNVELSDLNSFSMKQLASVLLCKPDATGVLTDLTHPNYKYIILESAPKTPANSLKFESLSNWQALILETVRAIKARKLPVSKGNKMASIANVLVTRGPQRPEIGDGIVEQFSTFLQFPKWVPSDYRWNIHHENRRFLNFDKYITLGSNCSDIYRPLNLIFEKAANLFSYRAYVHQYKKFNVHEQDYMEAFARMGSVVNSYNNIITSS